MIRKIRRGSALAAVFILLTLAAAPKVTYGALAVDTGRKDCSITFSLSSNDGFEELNSLPVPVALYRVAEVTANGAYRPENAYDRIGFDKVDSGTTAAQWEQMAKEAAGIAAPGILDENGRITAESLPEDGKTPYRELTAGGAGAVTAEDLETGMYLALAFAVNSPEYTYSFAPCLVAVPGNDYYREDAGSSGDDTWKYEVDVTLKPDRAERFGDLRITKHLSSCHAGDRASFIFQVEARKMEGGESKTVYSDVVELAFDAPGSRSIVLEGRIPAGASVTVTEVYQGAAYETESADAQTVQISAAAVSSVDFTNRYNGQLNGGNSIVNHFRPVLGEGQDGGPVVENWQWTQIQ